MIYMFRMFLRVEDNLLPILNLPKDEGGWHRAGNESGTIETTKRQSSAQTSRPDSHPVAHSLCLKLYAIIYCT